MKRLTYLFLVLPFMMAGCQIGESPTTGNNVSIIEEGESAMTARMNSYRGKVVLLDFWFTQCPPCINEIPHEKSIAKEFSGKPFAILGISRDGSIDELRKYLSSNPLPWVNIYDVRGSISKKWNVESFPTFVLIDHQGTVIGRWVGGGNSSKIEEAIAQALENVGK